MKEERKVVKYGDLGKNSATVTEETRNPNDLNGAYAQGLIRNAGKLFCPIGYDYLGSAAVHYYSREILPSNPTFMTACQTTGIDKVNENHASLGWKNLLSALKKCYGRADDRTNERPEKD